MTKQKATADSDELKTTIRLPAELHAKFKSRVAMNRTKMEQVVENLLRAYVEVGDGGIHVISMQTDGEVALLTAAEIDRIKHAKKP